MKIPSIFILFFLRTLLSQDDGSKVLWIKDDGLLIENAMITTTATCGLEGPEEFCRLVDERPDQKSGKNAENFKNGTVSCDICDDRNETKRHPIEFAKSNDDNLWWQSPSMAQGQQYQNVNVTIDLKQVYQIVYILLKMGDSPRPCNWILERSLDGEIYLPWIFFAEAPYTCYNVFRQQHPEMQFTSDSQPKTLDDDEVFCTTYYSQPNSLNSGEIIISLTNGRKSLSSYNYFATKSIPQTLINFLSARFIRFRFLKHLTFSADLMGNQKTFEKSIYNRYFYSLRNIEIGGKCICNNHADQCDKVIVDKIAISRCNCKHNTCGSNCEVCCPLFNQKPWKPIEPCEECNCNRKSTECVYNHTVATSQLSTNKMGRLEGGGVCINCQENTTGINCEKCKKRFFRPWNTLATEQFPCKPCQCDGIGTVGDCVSNGDEVDNQKPGDCICKIGYTGNNCQSCSIGYERYSNGECLPCPCGIDGSVTSSLYRCKPPCNCKINVETNEECKTCRNGYFNLDPKNPEGCQPCYCFGITNQCSSLNAQSLHIQDLTNWKISTINDNRKANTKMSLLQYPTLDNSDMDNFFNNPSVYYWVAPQLFLGNWLTSFGSILQYVVKIELTGPTEGSQIDSPDVIIKCGEFRLFHSISGEDRRLQRKVLIYLKPSYWEIGQSNPQKISTKDEFSSCLVNVESLMIKAKYYSNQNSIGLLNITLLRGDPEKAISEMPFIEKCYCNQGYSGLSCESCEVGYRRVNNTLFQGQCEPCQCYNHSNTCDPFTGECTNCQHNTHGLHCDECIAGYYGSPKFRKKNPCKKCACPSLDYQMTDRCLTIGSSNYICDDCKNNTTGMNCEQCVDGFYGNPRQKIKCKKCECNNNEESCSKKSGECKCSFNTMGEKCEICKYGFYGNAFNKTCKKCECDFVGSRNQNCDKTSGQCDCLKNFDNRKCDSCASGFYLTKGKCVSCVCDIRGRISSERFCDASSGRCHCLDGITGERCDKCSATYYGYPNCKKCQCSPHALSNECDAKDGRCKCGSFVTNTECDKCQDFHYWVNRTDCAACNCGQGAINGLCEMNTGNCKCSDNVDMRDCSKCKIGYYGLSPFGCKECPPCHNGQMCNNRGMCICPPNTAGKRCEECTINSWNYNKTFGCQKCDCFPGGSSSGKCNKATGDCLCQKSYKGVKCDECNHGFFGFPNCKPCQCSPLGTLVGKLFRCEPISGKCQCKSNAVGHNCEFCKKGTFPSINTYTGGCFSCFCLGITVHCQPLMNHRVVEDMRYEYNIFDEKISFLSKDDRNVIMLNPSHSKKFSWPLSSSKPVFVDVLQFFQSSDLSLFYRSIIMDVSISCLDKKCGRENLGPLEVIIESYDGLLELRYFVNRSLSNVEEFNIELSENIGQWVISKYRSVRLVKYIPINNSSIINTNLTRDIFMMALLNVTSLKLQLFPGKISSPIIKLKLVTYKAVETSEEVGKPITAVEKCYCNSISTGNHCQEPFNGYYKHTLFLPELPTKPDSRSGGRITVNIKKCDCNGHSTLCNGNTGHCLNCTNYTFGNKCEFCRDGFYGDPRNNGQCQPCQCPNAQYNFAKSCYKSPSSIDYICQCEKGYSGLLCERCEIGFYGNPIKGIPCKACECNRQGSLNDSCNSNGVCHCFPTVSGMKCDQCAVNHVVENNTCQSCYTGCTKQLFNRIEKFNISLMNFKWKTAPTNIDREIREMNISIQSFANRMIVLDKFYNLRNNISRLYIQFENTKATSKKKYDDAMKMKNIYIEYLNKINLIFKDINETTSNTLVDSSEHIIGNATDLLKFIEGLLREMPNTTESEMFLAQVIKHVNDLNEIINKTRSLLKLEQLSNLTILKNKTLIANDINKDNKAYVTMLEGKNVDYHSKIRLMEESILNFEKFLIVIKTKKNQLQEKIQKVDMVAENLQIRRESITTIIKLIDELMANLSESTSSKLLIPDMMKIHVEEQLKKSANLIKNLTKEFNFLHSAQQAKEAYSNISRDITEVDIAINTTKQQLDNSKSKLNLEVMNNVLIESNFNLSLLQSDKADIETKIEDLKNQYEKHRIMQEKLNTNNNQIMSKIPTGYSKTESIRKNISDIQVKQVNIQTKITKLNDSISRFEIPNLTSELDIDDIEGYVQNVSNHYVEMVTDTIDISSKIKNMREKIKLLRNRLSKAMITSDLIHGAVARSSEPIRHVEKCVRHYVTYYLPKSIAFSLEFYLKPQFPNQQSLVLFGYDDSQSLTQAFAFTIERNDQYRFWYDYGGTVETINLTKQLTKDNYAGIMIAWKKGKWEMQIRSTTDGQETQKETESIGNNNIINTIRIGPQTNVFIGGFPSQKLLGKLNLRGKLISELRENYGSNYYKGCIFGVRLMNSQFGLQDIEAIDEDCKKTISTRHLLLHPFSCKLNLENITKFKKSSQQKEKESDLYFTGNGYAMINTSNIGVGNCKTKLQKVLSISAMATPAMNTKTFQLIAVFANHIKDFGFVLGQQNGQYHLGFWNGSREKDITNLQDVSRSFDWNIFRKNIGNFTEDIFGIESICDPNSFIYLGDIPNTETKLIEKLKRLNVPNFGFSGSLRLLVNQENIFQILATRFINVLFLHSERLNIGNFQSLFISSDVNQAIEISRPLDYDILNSGFAFTIDFMGQPINKTVELLTIQLTEGHISISLSEDLVLSLKIHENELKKNILKTYNNSLDWGPHSVVVSFEPYSSILYVSIAIDNEDVQMNQFKVVLEKHSSIRIGSNSANTHGYYFYHLYLGQKLVNFNELTILPPGVFLKLRPTKLQPGQIENVKSAPFKETLRVSNKHGLQRDAAALPSEPLYTSSKLYLPLLPHNVTKYTYYSSKSEDYPMDSAWFDGMSNNIISLPSSITNQYQLSTDNEVSFMIRSASLRTEMLVSFNFGMEKTLSLITMDGHIILYDSITKWVAPFPVRLIDEEWHVIRITASVQFPEKGIKIYQDNHSFDFPLSPFTFSFPFSMEIGGYSGSNPKLHYKNKEYEVQILTGCFDSLKINQKIVKLFNGDHNNVMKQCPRVWEFLNTGGHIKDSYSQVNDSDNLIKLKIGNYTISDSDNTYVTKFKFKYTGVENGSILIIGDGSKFCSISIKNREVQLNYRNFENNEYQVDSIGIATEKWYKIEFIIYHNNAVFTLCKMLVDDNEASLTLSDSQMFSLDFKEPRIYFGGHPNLATTKVNQLTRTNRNFVGCISDLAFLANNAFVSCGFDKSKFIIGGRCSMDKNRFFRRSR